METFTFKGKEIEYFDHSYNTTRLNERTVEVSLAKLFLDMNLKPMVEIGCVTPYYFGETDHLVYDLTDRHPRAINKDADSIDVTGLNVLSISTMEHFNSISTIERILKTAKKYFITIPLGYNDIVDQYFLNHKDTIFISRQRVRQNLWEVRNAEDLTDYDKTYGSYHKASTIAIIQNIL